MDAITRSYLSSPLVVQAAGDADEHVMSHELGALVGQRGKSEAEILQPLGSAAGDQIQQRDKDIEETRFSLNSSPLPPTDPSPPVFAPSEEGHFVGSEKGGIVKGRIPLGIANNVQCLGDEGTEKRQAREHLEHAKLICKRYNGRVDWSLFCKENTSQHIYMYI